MSVIAPPRPRTPGWGRAEPPSIEERQGGGGGRGWVELVRAANDIEAHLLVGRLTEAGIETSTIKDRSASGAFLYGGRDPWAPVAVLVRRLQLDDARLLLAELAYEGPVAQPASPTPGPRGRVWLWWSAALALGLVLTALGLVGVMERCASSGACRGAVETPARGGSGVAGR